MSAIRTICSSCSTSFRVSKSNEYEKFPVPPQDVWAIENGQRVLKAAKGSKDPGRFRPKFTLCRPCFKAKNGQRRQSQPKRKRDLFAIANRQHKVATAPSKGKKGK
jgi:hypothetical protein